MIKLIKQKSGGLGLPVVSDNDLLSPKGPISINASLKPPKRPSLKDLVASVTAETPTDKKDRVVKNSFRRPLKSIKLQKAPTKKPSELDDERPSRNQMTYQTYTNTGFTPKRNT